MFLFNPFFFIPICFIIINRSTFFIVPINIVLCLFVIFCDLIFHFSHYMLIFQRIQQNAFYFWLTTLSTTSFQILFKIIMIKYSVISFNNTDDLLKYLLNRLSDLKLIRSKYQPFRIENHVHIEYSSILPILLLHFI